MPKLSEPKSPERRATAIFVRVTEAEREAMRSAAATAGTSMAALIRTAVLDLADRVMRESRDG